jgi:hypothetical protein
MIEPMDAQLHLLPDDDTDERHVDWRLDDSTRALGRQGVAQARSALRAAMRHRGLDDSDQPDHPDQRASAA